MQKEKNIINTTVILNSIGDLQRSTLINSARGRCQIKFGMTSLFNKSGFTLIELLVVVLIIGILAAIAVPQYQKAVKKANYMQALSITKHIATAQKAYYLANGVYADTFDQLDIQVPFTQSTCPATKGDWSYTDCAKAGQVTVALSNYMGDERGVRTGMCVRTCDTYNGFEYMLTDHCFYGNCKTGKLLSPGLYCRERNNTSPLSHCTGTYLTNHIQSWYSMP